MVHVLETTIRPDIRHRIGNCIQVQVENSVRIFEYTVVVLQRCVRMHLNENPHESTENTSTKFLHFIQRRRARAHRRLKICSPSEGRMFLVEFISSTSKLSKNYRRKTCRRNRGRNQSVDALKS
jgi:hypothetical protein